MTEPIDEVIHVKSLEQLVGMIAEGEAHCSTCNAPTPPHAGHRMHRKFLENGQAEVWFECRSCKETRLAK